MPTMKANKRLTILALWAKELHEGGICQHNHDLEYQNGWFYYDDEKPFQNPNLVQKAYETNKNGLTGACRYEGARRILFLTER